MTYSKFIFQLKTAAQSAISKGVKLFEQIPIFVFVLAAFSAAAFGAFALLK